MLMTRRDIRFWSSLAKTFALTLLCFVPFPVSQVGNNSSVSGNTRQIGRVPIPPTRDYYWMRSIAFIEELCYMQPLKPGIIVSLRAKNLPFCFQLISSSRQKMSNQA